jgi:ADP-heptose:LPS heptosyltransferase
MQQILEFCRKNFPEKTTVLNPIATKRRDYLYWESGRFDGSRTFVENLYTYCREILKFNVVTRSNGILAPEGVLPGRHARRVVIHPTSSREGKNWPREKYLALASQLLASGYAPAMLLTEKERKEWDPGRIDAPCFTNLGEMAAFVCESGGMIGNDSGVGHLASCLGVKTLTICRNAQASRFWRPSWARGRVVLPSSWIPNIKGMRLRDKHWKKWISVGKVLKSYHSI